jgi:hypothetical protein
MERAGETAHGDLEDRVQRQVHVQAVAQLEERGQLGQAAARLLQLHLLGHEARPEAADLALLVEDVEAEEDCQPDQADQDHPSARRDVVAQESGPHHRDPEGLDGEGEPEQDQDDEAQERRGPPVRLFLYRVGLVPRHGSPRTVLPAVLAYIGTKHRIL